MNSFNHKNQQIPISVVMVVRNEEKFISEAIQSILDQTFQEFEFIIIDDGSTDNTKRIIESFHDDRIRLYDNPNLPGRSGGLNYGYSIAKGKYIAHMDGDDISLPDRFKKQLDYMENHPEIGVLGGGMICFDGNGEKFNLTPSKKSHKEIFEDPFSVSTANPTVFLRVSSLPEFISYDDNFNKAEDFNFFSELSSYVKFSNLTEPLLRYRHHSEQTTQKHCKEVAELTFKVGADNLIKKYKEKGITKIPDVIDFFTFQKKEISLSELVKALKLAGLHNRTVMKIIKQCCKMETSKVNFGLNTDIKFSLIWVRYKLKFFFKRHLQ